MSVDGRDDVSSGAGRYHISCHGDIDGADFDDRGLLFGDRTDLSFLGITNISLARILDIDRRDPSNITSTREVISFPEINEFRI